MAQRQRMGHKAITSFIKFEEAGTSKSGLTRIWNVCNTMSGSPDYFGVIHWHGAWRKYVFECDRSFYDWDCLRLIADFIEQKTIEHRSAIK